MSLDINLTGVEKTSNKKTTLTDNSDTFYPTQKAVKTAVDAKFNTPTGTTAQYLRGDGSLDTFPTIPDVTGLQSKAVVVSTNQTAVNDGSYTVVSNATFTDPSPVEGKGYRVFVRNGTATINSVGYAEGTTILRLFHSGAWVSYVSLPDSNFVQTSRTINGLDLSANRTLTASDVGAVATNSAITGATKTKITYDAKGLVTSGTDATTADIADSTDKRYVTDAQLTVIGNTSGTNTGDQTLSGLGGVPTTRNITINGTTQDLSADTTYSAILLSGQPNGANTGVSGALRYFGFSNNVVSTSEPLRRIFLPNACTLKNFYIRTNSQPATGSHVLTILKNGVATSIVVTIPAGSAAGVFSDTTNSVSFLAGDEISIQAVNNATANSGVIIGYSIGNL
jgi:hypothetical protein